uniref:Uncharacterized protein n=1 Tax=Leersia perrieri TaxID=77586 RepID=A0A0D9XVV1_9ORYZ
MRDIGEKQFSIIASAVRAPAYTTCRAARRRWWIRTLDAVVFTRNLGVEVDIVSARLFWIGAQHHLPLSENMMISNKGKEITKRRHTFGSYLVPKRGCKLCELICWKKGALTMP